MYSSFNARALGLEMSADEAIEVAAENGFDGVDLMVRDLVGAESDLTRLRERMNDLGLKAGAWPLPVRWRGDEAIYREDLCQLPRLADAAMALGLSRTGTWVLPETTEFDKREADPAEAVARSVAFHQDRLGEIARVLDDRGTRLGLEVIGVASFRTGRGWPFVTRLADLVPVLGPILDAHENVGIVLDAFHLHAAGEDPSIAFALGADRIVWAHIADLPRGTSGPRDRIRDDDRGLPGESGLVNVSGLLQRLKQEGYDGPVIVETLASCRSMEGFGARDVVRAAAESLRRVWPRTNGE